MKTLKPAHVVFFVPAESPEQGLGGIKATQLKILAKATSTQQLYI